MKRTNGEKSPLLSHYEFCILCCLCDFGSSPNLAELVDHLKMLADFQTSGPSLTGMLKRMEKDNWVTTSPKRVERNADGSEHRGRRYVNSWGISESGINVLTQHFFWERRVSNSAREDVAKAEGSQWKP